MDINVKDHSTLILFLLQFLVFTPLVFYTSAFLRDYREHKAYVIERLDQCVTYEQMNVQVNPIWQLLIENEKRTDKSD